MSGDLQLPAGAYIASMVGLGIEDGLVPLTIAVRIAYKVLTPASFQVATEEEFAELTPVVALALAMVTPVYRRTSRDAAPTALDPGEIQWLLVHADSSRSLGPTLFVRRADLNSAVDTLRGARVV